MLLGLSSRLYLLIRLDFVNRVGQPISGIALVVQRTITEIIVHCNMYFYVKG